MTTTITPRIGGAAATSATKRVATSGAFAGSGSGIGGDTWGNSWGGAWGRCWFLSSAAADATDASPTVDVTPRIGAVPATNTTKRVTF